MNTPVLLPVAIEDLPASALDAVPPSVPGLVRCFRVACAGRFDGRWFQPGDVVVCAGVPEADDRVVLVPTGRGRPCFGHRRMGGLTGDLGEPCDAARWQPAGRVVRVLPRLVAAPAEPVQVALPQRRVSVRLQLPLFPVGCQAA